MHKFKPLNDYIFGKTFGEKGDEEQLLSLLICDPGKDEA